MKVQPEYCLCEGATQLHKQHKLQLFNPSLNLSCDTLVSKWLKTLCKLLILRRLRYFEEQMKRISREWDTHTDICATRSFITSMILRAERKKQIKKTSALVCPITKEQGDSVVDGSTMSQARLSEATDVGT